MAIEKNFEQLQKDLSPYQPLLSNTSDTILDQEISRYPVFVIHQQMVEIGVPMLIKKEGGPQWSVNASTLEELATKKVVEMTKVDQFRKIFKDPLHFFCLFVITEENASFVFIPRLNTKN